MTTLPLPPAIVRFRHETRRRILTVVAVRRVTPNMIRISLSGEDLDGFTSLSPDDHVKLFVPAAETGKEPQMRDYTPRHFDAASRVLTIDFAVHDAGPATAWALAAQPGDWVQIGGPRGSQVITGPVQHWLLIGDETALPAIGRRIEEAAVGTRITAIMAVAGPADEQHFVTKAVLETHWLHRPLGAAASPTPLLAKLRDMPVPAGTFVWIAAEAQVARALRSHLLQDRNHPPGWMKAAGYWVEGRADTTEKFD